MKIGVVPASLVAKAGGRLDAEYYIGDPLGADIAKTEKRLLQAEARLEKLRKAHVLQEEERRRLGILTR